MGNKISPEQKKMLKLMLKLYELYDEVADIVASILTLLCEADNRYNKHEICVDWLSEEEEEEEEED